MPIQCPQKALKEHLLDVRICNVKQAPVCQQSCSPKTWAKLTQVPVTQIFNATASLPGHWLWLIACRQVGPPISSAQVQHQNHSITKELIFVPNIAFVCIIYLASRSPFKLLLWGASLVSGFWHASHLLHVSSPASRTAKFLTRRIFSYAMQHHEENAFFFRIFFFAFWICCTTDATICYVTTASLTEQSQAAKNFQKVSCVVHLQYHYASSLGLVSSLASSILTSYL